MSVGEERGGEWLLQNGRQKARESTHSFYTAYHSEVRYAVWGVTVFGSFSLLFVLFE